MIEDFDMKRIDTSVERIKGDIADFYRPDKQHFIVMNAMDLGEKIEVQWFFNEYAEPYETTAFCTQISPGTEIPSISDIIPSAWVAEAELVDLLDLKIGNTAKGFVLEPDFATGPLRKNRQDGKTI